MKRLLMTGVAALALLTAAAEANPMRLAIHNGSVMRVVPMPDRGHFEIRYYQPRPGMLGIVGPGTLLVDGVWISDTFRATAYIFTPCGAVPYAVSGHMEAAVLVLEGPAPVTDYFCNIVGYRWNDHSLLTFEPLT